MARERILIVDDELAYTQRLSVALEGMFDIEICTSEAEFRLRYLPDTFGLVIMDMRLKKDREGLVALREVLERDPLQPAIVITAYSDMETHARALEAGAMSYLDKNEFSPVLVATIVQAIMEQGKLRRRLHAAQRQLDHVEPKEIIGATPETLRLREQIRLAAGADQKSVLLIGERGAGKSLAAWNIHRYSPRRSARPFVVLRSGQLGAPWQTDPFDGAMRQANGGVLYVEDVQSLDAALVKRLIELVATHSYSTGNGSLQSSVRLIASLTSSRERTDAVRDLVAGFRKADALLIEVPPLDDRKDDIALLAPYFFADLLPTGEDPRALFERSGHRKSRGAVLARQHQPVKGVCGIRSNHCRYAWGRGSGPAASAGVSWEDRRCAAAGGLSIASCAFRDRSCGERHEASEYPQEGGPSASPEI